MRARLICILAVATLTACSGQDGLRDVRSLTGGPDEFSVLPTRPLDLPADLSALPAPTPGAANRTDANPAGDAIAALGGDEAANRAGGIPASDGALVSRASRFGTDPAIRSTLAAEDAAFRARRSRLSILSILNRDRYFRAYAAQSLDAYAEFIRFRNVGVQVPSAPPQN